MSANVGYKMEPSGEITEELEEVIFPEDLANVIVQYLIQENKSPQMDGDDDKSNKSSLKFNDLSRNDEQGEPSKAYITNASSRSTGRGRGRGARGRGRGRGRGGSSPPKNFTAISLDDDDDDDEHPKDVVELVDESDEEMSLNKKSIGSHTSGQEEEDAVEKMETDEKTRYRRGAPLPDVPVKRRRKSPHPPDNDPKDRRQITSIRTYEPVATSPESALTSPASKRRRGGRRKKNFEESATDSYAIVDDAPEFSHSRVESSEKNEPSPHYFKITTTEKVSIEKFDSQTNQLIRKIVINKPTQVETTNVLSPALRKQISTNKSPLSAEEIADLVSLTDESPQTKCEPFLRKQTSTNKEIENERKQTIGDSSGQKDIPNGSTPIVSTAESSNVDSSFQQSLKSLVSFENRSSHKSNSRRKPVLSPADDSEDDDLHELRAVVGGVYQEEEEEHEHKPESKRSRSHIGSPNGKETKSVIRNRWRVYDPVMPTLSATFDFDSGSATPLDFGQGRGRGSRSSRCGRSSTKKPRRRGNSGRRRRRDALAENYEENLDQTSEMAETFEEGIATLMVEPLEQIFAGMRFVLTSSAFRNKGKSLCDASQEDFLNPIPFNKEDVRVMLGDRGGIVVDEFKMFEDTSSNCYLIADRHYRTHKYLSAIARAVPCVSHMWVYDSCNQKKCLRPENYLLPAGLSLETNQLIDWHDECPKLLSGLSVYVYSENQLNNQAALYFVQIWLPLVRCMGATVVHGRIPNGPDAHLDLFVTDDSCPDSVLALANKIGASAVSSEWLIQAIITGTKPATNGHPKYRYNYSE